jgi:hypothetical protein
MRGVSMANALRSLLRFLQQRGDIATNLAASVPSVANWSLGGLRATIRCRIQSQTAHPRPTRRL